MPQLKEIVWRTYNFAGIMPRIFLVEIKDRYFFMRVLYTDIILLEANDSAGP
jgi:hypothetical protein